MKPLLHKVIPIAESLNILNTSRYMITGLELKLAVRTVKDHATVLPAIIYSGCFQNNMLLDRTPWLVAKMTYVLVRLLSLTLAP